MNDICHIFIVGSDQLWNYELFGHSMEFYGLAFVNGDNKKISYGTSLGSVPFPMPDNKKSIMRMLLQRFDFVSVREADGAAFCNEVFGTNAEQVLDPVFLCDPDSYFELIKKSAYYNDLKLKEPYIFCYIIHPTEEKIEFIRALSKRKNRKVVCIGDALHADMDFYGLERVLEAKVEDWLALLYHSSCVAADSFHAYCFSVIFEKSIFPIYNSRSFSNRVESLSESIGAVKPIYLFHYKNRMNDLLNELEDERLPASREKLQKEIIRSKDWLLKAMEDSEKKEQKAESDVLISLLLKSYNYEKRFMMQMDMIRSQKKLIEDQNELIRQLNGNIEEYRVELLNKQKKMAVKDKEEIMELIHNMRKED